MILNDTEIIYFLLKNFLIDYLKTDCTKDAPLKIMSIPKNSAYIRAILKYLEMIICSDFDQFTPNSDLFYYHFTAEICIINQYERKLMKRRTISVVSVLIGKNKSG
ncbi:hypothetical protein J2T03_001634 [Chryseobacterium lathyri]|nr:hypothetical protein [Chryseobacterium lathyri]